VRHPASRGKAANDAIVDFELCDALSNGFHNPCSVRHRYAAVGYSVGRDNNAIVMKIERACMQAHPERPWSRRSRIGLLYTFDSIQAARCFNDDGFHDDLQFERVAPMVDFIVCVVRSHLLDFPTELGGLPFRPTVAQGRKPIVFSPTNLTEGIKQHGPSSARKECTDHGRIKGHRSSNRRSIRRRRQQCASRRAQHRGDANIGRTRARRSPSQRHYAYCRSAQIGRSSSAGARNRRHRCSRQ
jgi:hypothetical protein